MANFPDQIKLRNQLQRKDPAKIAEKTGTGLENIRKMLNGERRMSDQVKAEILRILENRRRMDEKLNQLVESGQ